MSKLGERRGRFMHTGKIAAGAILAVSVVAVAGACSGQSGGSPPICTVKVEDISTGSDAYVSSLADSSACGRLATALRNAYRGYDSNGVKITEPVTSWAGNMVCSGNFGAFNPAKGGYPYAVNVYKNGGGEMARKICGDLPYQIPALST
jgi:hypothetical protein